ncbi:MAG: SprT-like domain-containing protein [Bacteroidetes bacterium]|nr:SprT-like domain-containing protein [Bacteroidota bacterium]
MGLEALDKYLPAGAYKIIERMIKPHSVLIKIKNARATKLGDYRLMNEDWKHQITINNDLNKYAFLVTLVHELAHLYTFEKHRDRVKPHGNQWKNQYVTMMLKFVGNDTFPTKLEQAVIEHLESPSASSCTDLNLHKALRRYDRYKSDIFTIESLEEGEHFIWNKDRVFKKGEILRTRYKCVELKTRRAYFFHPLTEVEKHSL